MERATIILPPHKAGLYLTHNEHKLSYATVAELAKTEFARVEDFVSPEERQRAIDMDELWCLQWYPETPVGFHSVYASSLDAINRWLEAQTLIAD